MSPQPASNSSIYWPSVITVISAAILIGLNDTSAHILQAVLFGLGVLIMVAFIRNAQRIEPFSRRG
jgi:hypothetical protein